LGEATLTELWLKIGFAHAGHLPYRIEDMNPFWIGASQPIETENLGPSLTIEGLIHSIDRITLRRVD
tara:strand:- start:1667 stop:1867 length:201 start_codon:yes stop_codon:yes gene_type:complete